MPPVESWPSCFWPPDSSNLVCHALVSDNIFWLDKMSALPRGLLAFVIGWPVIARIGNALRLESSCNLS